MRLVSTRFRDSRVNQTRLPSTMMHCLYFFCSFVLFGLPAILGQSSDRSYTCREPAPIKHGSWSVRGGGTFVSYRCLSGFSMYGKQTLRCRGDRQWSGQPPICVAPGCSPLPKFHNGRATIRNDGAVVTYKCARGTWIHGSKTIFCDGTLWNDTVPTCRQSSSRPDFLPISNCPPVPTVQGAIVVKSFESVSYACTNRTIPTMGSQILRCLSNGRWDREPVICAKPGCSRLNQPANGMIIEMHSLSVVEFRCFLHYHLIGSRVLFCDGQQWNGTIPLCVQDIPVAPLPTSPDGQESSVFTVQEGTSCGQAPPIRYGRPSYTTELDAQGSTYWSVTYLCDSGYRLLRRSRLFCSRGVWVGETPQCVAHCGVHNGGCAHSCLDINGRASCICRRGYRLHINGRSCNDVNECAPNSGRGPCGESCHNHDGDYSCSCQRGYRLQDDGHTCVYQAVDPCSRIRCAYGSCSTVNGTPTCQCPRGFVLSRDERTCRDINECSRSVSPCEHGCRNIFGSYECSCPSGSALVNGRRCEECGVNTYLSSNRKRCKPCPPNSAAIGATRTSIGACECKPGFEGNLERGMQCQDINECALRNGGCEQACVNTDGSHFCKCNPGYTLDIDDQRSCIEINECALNNGGCLHECRNSPGSFSCICNEGYAVDPFDRYTCMDVDECAFDSSRCEHVCVNLVGGYRCECNRGYSLDPDGRTCSAERCAPLIPPKNGTVNRTCVLAEGDIGIPFDTVCSYECDAGYRLDGEKERVCMSQGLWSGADPRCIQIQCPSLAPPRFGQMRPATCSLGPSELLTSCHFSCDGGFTHLGASVLTCTSSGEWSNRTPICSRGHIIRCPENVTATLPAGASQMTIDLPEADHTLDMVNSTYSLTAQLFGVGSTTVVYSAYSNDTSIKASCEMTVNVLDEEPPQLIDCPLSFTMKIQEQYVASLDVPQPVFTDNVAVVNVSRDVEPNGPFTWGTYVMYYTALDAAGNTATCLFEITIRPLSGDCGVLDGPLHGNHFCSPWPHGLICQPTCMHGFYFFDGPLPTATYTCGRDAQWIPAKKVPDCTAFELVSNVSVPCAAGKQLKTYPVLNGPACMDCPRGTYSVDLGPHHQPVCKRCPQGLYQDRPGQISCLVCPDGSTTNFAGAASIRDCRDSTLNIDTVTEPAL